MNFSVTERRSRMLIRNGYMYVFQKILANDVRCYECVLCGKVECKGKAKLGADNSFLEQLNVDTHPPSQANIEVHKVKANIKRKALTTNDTCQ